MTRAHAAAPYEASWEQPGGFAVAGRPRTSVGVHGRPRLRASRKCRPEAGGREANRHSPLVTGRQPDRPGLSRPSDWASRAYRRLARPPRPCRAGSRA